MAEKRVGWDKGDGITGLGRRVNLMRMAKKAMEDTGWNRKQAASILRNKAGKDYKEIGDILLDDSKVVSYTMLRDKTNEAWETMMAAFIITNLNDRQIAQYVDGFLEVELTETGDINAMIISTVRSFGRA